MEQKFGKGVKYLRDISEYVQKNVTDDKIKEVLDVIEKVKKEFMNN